MNPENLSVRLRPRNRWEAADLGFAMVRAWRGGVYPPWLAITVPVSLALIFTLGGWGFVLFWWLLPLFEASVLFVLSRAVFGEMPTPRETLRAAGGEARRAWREVFLRRLHPGRLFAFAIGQLEGLRRAQRRTRRRVLSHESDPQSTVALIFFCIELLLFGALFGLVEVLTPVWLGFDWEQTLSYFVDGLLPSWAYALFYFAWALVIIAVRPFHVAAGFALYLDRRTVLEGWDLEIAFRRLARRLRRMEGGRTAATQAEPRHDGRAPHRAAVWWWVLAASALWLPLMTTATVEAEESEAEPVPPAVWNGPAAEDPRRIAEEITSRPEFGGSQTVESWQLREDLTRWLDEIESSPPPAAREDRPSPFLLSVVRLLTWAGEASLWLLMGIVLLAVLVVAIRRWPEARGRSVDASVEAPETLLGFDLRHESLPADIPGEAERLWRDGELAAALSLLYRGALARLVGDGVRLAESFTEDDCLRAARAVLPPLPSGYFAELTRVWQKAAYAHRLPPAEEGERWWAGWRRHFGAAEGPS